MTMDHFEPCPYCGAPAGQPCHLRTAIGTIPLAYVHVERIMAAVTRKDADL